MSKKEQELITKADLLYDYAGLHSSFRTCSHDLGHLYIFRKKHDENDADDWSGKINATTALLGTAKEEISHEVEKVQAEVVSVNSDIQGLQNAMQEMRDGIQAMEGDLKKEMK